MTLKEAIENILSEGKNPSSKRVAGFLGWLVCLVASIYGINHTIVSPNIIEMMFWASCGLLGLDSITGAFKWNNNCNNGKK